MSVLSLQDCADANILKDIKARRKIPYNKLLIKEYCIDYMENYFTSTELSLCHFCTSTTRK